jgi:molybdenum cofactor cytidylyltransferase
MMTRAHSLSLLSASDCVIALADLPFIQPETIREVVNALKPSGIVISTFQEQRSHPVALVHEYYPYLLKMKGENGAKSVAQGFAN